MTLTNIRKIRKAKGVTLEELSARTGLSVSYLSRMQSDARNVSAKNLRKIADGLEVSPADLVETQTAMAPIVGKAGAGPDGMVLFAESDGNFGEIAAPVGATPEVRALEVEGHSMRGLAEDGWVIFYDEIIDPGQDAFDELCVCWLDDGRVLVKILQPGREPGLFNLESTTAPTLRDVLVRQVALVTSIMPRKQAQKFIRRNPAFPVQDAEIAKSA